MLLFRNFNILHSNYRKVTTKWTCITCVRSKSSAKPKTKAYSHTILFPKTDFPARSNVNKTEIQKVIVNFYTYIAIKLIILCLMCAISKF